MKAARLEKKMSKEGVHTDAMKQELDELSRCTENHTKELKEAQQSAAKLPLRLRDITGETLSKTFIRKSLYQRASERLSCLDDTPGQNVRGKEDLIRELGWLFKFQDTQDFLEEHPELLNRATAEELSRICISLAIEEKVSALRHVAGQCVLLLYIVRLARSTDSSPLLCLYVVINRMKLANAQDGRVSFIDHKKSRMFHPTKAVDEANDYYHRFCEDVEDFVWYVHEHATKHIKGQMQQAEDTQNQSDAVTTLENLPTELRHGFEQQSIPMVTHALSRMTGHDANMHMKKCVAAGLWVPSIQDSSIDQTTGLKTVMEIQPKLGLDAASETSTESTDSTLSQETEAHLNQYEEVQIMSHSESSLSIDGSEDQDSVNSAQNNQSFDSQES